MSTKSNAPHRQRADTPTHDGNLAPAAPLSSLGADQSPLALPVLRAQGLEESDLRDLRSDHAGEAGAVCIYQGILALTSDAELQSFAQDHMETERAHLAFFEDLLPPAERSRLLPVWKLAGFLTGALPTLFGRNAVFVTIEAVETFVDDHYKQQVIALSTRPHLAGLGAILERFRRDEVHHRQDAGARVCESVGIIARSWRYLVGAGSRAGVWLARRI